MGVTQLWSVLHPCARPTKLEALNRKRLAVDASIWIYQFLKAVRDKEGNALRNSHVVGFFRRICKLLYFGIKPVFVFDGGAPALKRQTILGRKRRREGRRDDATRTAGKLLAMQMQRVAEEAEEKRKREIEVRGRPTEAEEDEELPDDQNLVYVDELGMSNQERQQSRKFVKKDQYHLPDLNGDISNMGQPNDPRIMSAEELEEFARQHNSGENVDLYDFSKIDFDGDFFKCLPPADRYNILNAARLRSRLRMGLSKEQLEEMFPDRMAFSKFQVERVRERNDLTQRLMNLNGMNAEDTMGNGRIAGERGREYMLVKNEGVEGGWALGVVSKDRDRGERNKPIDIDALHERTQVRPNDEELEDDDEFEDVPVEGLNRLPTEQARFQKQMDHIKALQLADDDIVEKEQAPTNSLFVEQDEAGDLFEESEHVDEEEELNRAIAMSLQKSFAAEESEEEADFEDVQMPAYEQKSAKDHRPLQKSSGNGLIHIVNNRANAAVPKRMATESSDEEENLQDILAASRKQKGVAGPSAPTPSLRVAENPFGSGPLPFEKLDLKKSIFSGYAKARPNKGKSTEKENEDLAGGFEREDSVEKARPLPPWLASTGDIRADVKEQMAKDQRVNAEDYERRLEEERMYKRDHGVIEIESSDDDSDVEIVEAPAPKVAVTDGRVSPSNKEKLEQDSIASISNKPADLSQQQAEKSTPAVLEDRAETNSPSDEEPVEWSESDREEPSRKQQQRESSGLPKEPSSSPKNGSQTATAHEKSPSPTFEDVELHEPMAAVAPPTLQEQEYIFAAENDEAFNQQPTHTISDDEFGDFSDPDDEELLAHLALEAEEHARFASSLNNKAPQVNQEDYERELKQLRNQQKKDRRDADEVSHIMVTECQALLRLFGLPYITAPMEAEAQCAELVTLGLVDGIITDDSDVFLFGGTRVYKNMFNSNKFVECYLASDLEKELSLPRDKLIEFAHLLGSDYTEGLPGIGPVTALEIISEFPSSDGLQEFKDWWYDVQHNQRPKEADSKSSFRKKFRKSQASKLFLPPAFPSKAVTEAYLHADVDSTPDPFQWGVPDLDNLRSFLMATIGWTPERTDEVLVPVIQDMNRREAEGTQANITRYFDGAVGAGARAGGVEVEVHDGGGLLNTTFADEAAEWARKNELSEAAHVAKQQAKKGKPKSKKRGVGEEEGEADDGDVEDGVDVGSSGQAKGKRAKRARGGKA
ncbi:DNA repair protein rad2 [Pseudogymnoascus australis]